NALAFALVVLALDRMLRADPAARVRAHMLWSLNPLLLWGLVAAGHVDTVAAAVGFLALALVSPSLAGRGEAGGQPRAPARRAARRAPGRGGGRDKSSLLACGAGGPPSPPAGRCARCWPRAPGRWPCWCRRICGSGRRRSPCSSTATPAPPATTSISCSRARS